MECWSSTETPSSLIAIHKTLFAVISSNCKKSEVDSKSWKNIYFISIPKRKILSALFFAARPFSLLKEKVLSKQSSSSNLEKKCNPLVVLVDMDSFMLYYLLGHWKAGPRKIATFVCNWGKFGHNHALICLAKMPTFQSDMIPFLALRHRPCNVAGKTFPVLLRPIVFELQGNFHQSWRR